MCSPLLVLPQGPAQRPRPQLWLCQLASLAPTHQPWQEALVGAAEGSAQLVAGRTAVQ
jgi:hypothetical protein